MTTATTPVTVLSEIESILKVDLLQAASPAALNFLETMAKNPTPVGVVAAFITLRGQLLAALPALESALITQLDNWLIGKLQGALTPVAA